MKALIFDVDGTLAETEEIHRQAFNAAFKEVGLDWHWSIETYTRLLKTTGGKERMRIWREEIGSAISDTSIAVLHRCKTDLYGQLLSGNTLSLRPGIADLISLAKDEGLRLAIATTTSRANVDVLCQTCFGEAALDVFDVIAAGDEVQQKKPAPDVYQLALARLELDPDLAIAIEDSRNGVLSAKAAGLRVIAAPSLYTFDDDLSAADIVTDRLQIELLDRFGIREVSL